MATSKPSKFTWTDKNPACVAAFNILEGDNLLNQFDTSFLPFNEAGDIKLSTLPYFPKFGADPRDVDGRAAQMARQYFTFLIRLFTNRKERPMDGVRKVLEAFKAEFASTTSTIASLAAVTDDFLKFK